MKKGDFENLIAFAFLSICLVLLSACSTEKAKIEDLKNKSSSAIKKPEADVNIFDSFLKTDYDSADGFDFPFDNVDGEGSRQRVFTTANGRVVFAENCGELMGNVIAVEHNFYVNNEKRGVRSIYIHLQEVKVKIGDNVRRRQLIAETKQDSENSISP